ncbi:hypothetical protein CHS0354_007309, partial [Potamilus streckersoni]
WNHNTQAVSEKNYLPENIKKRRVARPEHITPLHTNRILQEKSPKKTKAASTTNQCIADQTQLYSPKPQLVTLPSASST